MKRRIYLMILLATALFSCLITIAVANAGVQTLKSISIENKQLPPGKQDVYTVISKEMQTNTEVNINFTSSFTAPNGIDEDIHHIFTFNQENQEEQASTGDLRIKNSFLELNWNGNWYQLQQIVPGKKYVFTENITEGKMWALVNGNIVFTNNANGSNASTLEENRENLQLIIHGFVDGQINYDLSADVHYNRTSIRYWLTLSVPTLLFGVSICLLMFTLSRKYSNKIQVLSSSFFTQIATTTLAASTVVLFGQNLLFSANIFNPPSVRFSDILQLQILSTGDPYEFVESNYPTFGLASLIPTLGLNDNVVIVLIFVTSIAVITGIFCGALGTNISTIWPGIIICLSYPTFFAIDRGNTELVVLAITMVSLLFLETRYKWLSSIGFGLSGGLKIFPLAVLFPLIKYRKYWGVIFIAGLTFIFLTLISGKLLGVTPIDSLKSITGAGVSASDINSAERFGLSLRSGLLTISHWLIPGTEDPANILNRLFSNPMNIFFLCITAFILLWAIFFEQEYWSSTAIILIAIFVFSPITYEYRAIMLFIPLYLFAKSREQMKYKKTLAILFGLALSPLHFWSLNSEGLGSGTVITPIVYFILLIVLILDSLARKRQRLVEPILVQKYNKT